MLHLPAGKEKGQGLWVSCCDGQQLWKILGKAGAGMRLPLGLGQTSKDSVRSSPLTDSRQLPFLDLIWHESSHINHCCIRSLA